MSEFNGNEGLYKLGTRDGSLVFANAFESTNEDGYIDYSVFQVNFAMTEFEYLDGGLYSGYATFEELVEDVAKEFVDEADIKIEFLCDCVFTIETLDDFDEVLSDFSVEEKVSPLLAFLVRRCDWNQSDADSMVFIETLDELVADGFTEKDIEVLCNESERLNLDLVLEVGGEDPFITGYGDLAKCVRMGVLAASDKEQETKNLGVAERLASVETATADAKQATRTERSGLER